MAKAKTLNPAQAKQMIGKHPMLTVNRVRS